MFTMTMTRNGTSSSTLNVTYLWFNSFNLRKLTTAEIGTTYIDDGLLNQTGLISTDELEVRSNMTVSQLMAQTLDVANDATVGGWIRVYSGLAVTAGLTVNTDGILVRTGGLTVLHARWGGIQWWSHRIG